MYEYFLQTLLFVIFMASLIFPLYDSCERRMQEYAAFITGSLIVLPVLIHALAQTTTHCLPYHVMLHLYYAYAILVLGVFARTWYRPANLGRMFLTWAVSPVLLVLALCGVGKNA